MTIGILTIGILAIGIAGVLFLRCFGRGRRNRFLVCGSRIVIQLFVFPGVLFDSSLNLDPRSIWLNFEITLAIFDPAYTRELRALQQMYLDDAEQLTLAAWQQRSFPQRLAENVARLVGPLL